MNLKSCAQLGRCRRVWKHRGTEITEESEAFYELLLRFLRDLCGSVFPNIFWSLDTISVVDWFQELARWEFDSRLMPWLRWKESEWCCQHVLIARHHNYDMQDYCLVPFQSYVSIE